ncbi:hypothetical protein GCM10027040_34280 [Halomonas shantousis]
MQAGILAVSVGFQGLQRFEDGLFPAGLGLEAGYTIDFLGHEISGRMTAVEAPDNSIPATGTGRGRAVLSRDIVG